MTIHDILAAYDGSVDPEEKLRQAELLAEAVHSLLTDVRSVLERVMPPSSDHKDDRDVVTHG